MSPFRALIALAPVLGWALSSWAAWHFGWYFLLLPLGLVSLFVPAAFGYAAVAVLPGSARSGRSASVFIALAAVASLSVAYACGIYALGRVGQLLPDLYKFGSGLVDVSRSTVRLWVVLSAFCLLSSLAVRQWVAPGSRASILSRATVGMVVCSAVVFVPFLLSPYAAYRA